MVDYDKAEVGKWYWLVEQDDKDGTLRKTKVKLLKKLRPCRTDPCRTGASGGPLPKVPPDDQGDWKVLVEDEEGDPKEVRLSLLSELPEAE